MGIKGFTTWFLKNFPFVASIIQRNANKTRFFDHIYIDLNQLIHLCARKAKNEEHLFLKVFKELDRLFRLCCPRKSVYLVLDGPASKAKLLEQRKRRKKAASKPSKGKQSFDALQITPGTYFMHRLKNSLCYYVCNRLQKSRRFERVKFYVSGSDVAGEGEIKIVNYIKNKPTYHRPEDSYLIVGTDADLILLGLCVDERNVFVMAERVHEYFLLSVSRLRRYFENSLSTKPRDENTFNKSGSSHLDFVLLSFMMGNDYLPKFKGASLPKLWPRYITLKRGEYADSFLYNPSTETFNVPFLQALMSRPRYNRKDKDDNQNTAEQKADSSMPNEPPNNVVNSNNANTNKADEGNVGDENVNEDDVEDEKQGDMPEMTAKDEAEVRQWIETHGVQMTDDILESELDSDNDDIVASSSSDEVFDEEFDDEVVVYGANWQFQRNEPRPRKEPLTREERDDQALIMVQKYLEGLLWCLYTYTKGACADYDWHFEFPFAPGARDLNYFMYSANQTPNLIKSIRTPYLSRDKGPLAPYKFSLSVLPYTANPYLAEPIRPLMEPSGALGDIFHLDQKFVDTEKIDIEVSKIPLDQFNAEELKFINFSHVSRFENQFGPKGQHNSKRKFNFRDFDAVPFPPSPKLYPIEPFTRLTCTEVDSTLKPVVHQGPVNQPSPRNRRGGQYVPKQPLTSNNNATVENPKSSNTTDNSNARGRNYRHTRNRPQNTDNSSNAQPSISIRTSETIMQVPVNAANDLGYTPYVKPPTSIAVNPVEAFIAQQQFLMANNLPPVPWTNQPIYPMYYNTTVSPQEQYYNNLMAQYQNAFFNNLMRDLNNDKPQEQHK